MYEFWPERSGFFCLFEKVYPMFNNLIQKIYIRYNTINYSNFFFQSSKDFQNALSCFALSLVSSYKMSHSVSSFSSSWEDGNYVFIKVLFFGEIILNMELRISCCIILLPQRKTVSVHSSMQATYSITLYWK